MSTNNYLGLLERRYDPLSSGFVDPWAGGDPTIEDISQDLARSRTGLPRAPLPSTSAGPEFKPPVPAMKPDEPQPDLGQPTINRAAFGLESGLNPTPNVGGTVSRETEEPDPYSWSARKAFMEHLRNMPQYKDPGVLANIAAAMGGVSAGWQQGAGEGLAVSEGYRQLPYKQQLGRWQAMTEPLLQASNLEERGDERRALEKYRNVMVDRPLVEEQMKQRFKREEEAADVAKIEAMVKSGKLSPDEAQEAIVFRNTGYKIPPETFEDVMLQLPPDTPGGPPQVKLVQRSKRHEGYIDPSTGKAFTPPEGARVLPNQSGGRLPTEQLFFATKQAELSAQGKTPTSKDLASWHKEWLEQQPVGFSPYVGGTGVLEGFVTTSSRGGAGPKFMAPPEGAEGLRKSALPSGILLSARDVEQNERQLGALLPMYKKDFVGPWRNRLYNLNAQLPEGLRQEIDPEEAAFRAANAKFSNAIIKYLGASQVPPAEEARILKEIPSPQQPPEIWEGNYKASLDNVKLLKQIMQEQGLMQGTPGQAPSAGITKPTPDEIRAELARRRNKAAK